MDCLFCKIINGEIKSEIIFEDEKVMAFKDINPQAETHILVVPKIHIESAASLDDENYSLAGYLILTAKKIAEQKGFLKDGYKLLFNVGRGGGQIIDHIHLHILSGKKESAQ